MKLEEDNVLVSIIVPVYNAEKYIKKCIDSILQQSYKNFELILVEDGSPDKCPEICDQYAKQDSRVRVIHKRNEGVSAARNSGLQISKGEYIFFVDSDDFVSKTYLEHLMSPLDIDYVVSGYFRGKDQCWEQHGYLSVQFNIYELCKKPELIGQVPLGMVWARKYKRSIIYSNGIKFDTTMARGEDVLFNVEYLLKCKTINIISVIDYYYNQTENSATEQFNPNLFSWSMKSILKIAEITGKDNDVFLTRVWNNAMLVCDNYFLTSEGKGWRIQFQMIKSVFQVCRNIYVRKSIKYGKNSEDKNRALLIKMYIYPFFPFIYKIYKWLKRIWLKERKVHG